MSSGVSPTASTVTENSEQEIINRLVQEEIQLRRFGNLNEGFSFSKQQQLEALWQADKSSLALISSTLRKTDSLSTKMVETLDSFDGRVQNLLSHINQVQDKTNRWKQIHSNITKSVSSMDDVLQKFERIRAARSIIKKRLVLQPQHQEMVPVEKKPQRDSSNSDLYDDDFESEAMDTLGMTSLPEESVPVPPPPVASDVMDLDSYLLQLDQLVDLERYFVEHQRFQSAADALNELSELIRASSEHIYQFYDEILRANSSPLNVMMIPGEAVQLRRGASENLLPPDTTIQLLCLDKQGIIQLMPEQAIRDLLKLMKRLQQQQGTRSERGFHTSEKTYLQLYVDRRLQFLQHTLQNAFNETSMARGAIHGAGSASAQPDTISTPQTPSKGVVGSVVGGTGKIIASMINAEKVEQKRRDKEFLESATSYERGNHLFLLYMEILLVLCRSERALTETLVGSAAAGKSHLAVYAKIVSSPVAQWYELGDTLLKSLRRNPNRVYGTSVMLDIYGTLQQLLQLFEEAFAGCPASADDLSGVNNFWAKLTTTIRQIFSQFLEDIKADPMRQLPSDGTVSELNSMSINFLRHLFDFKEILGELLPQSAASSKKSPLGGYIFSVLANLKENLDEKARKEKNKTLSNIFLLNNYYFVVKSLDGANNQLGSEVGTRAMQQCRSWVDEQRDAYRSTIDTLTEYLNEDKYRDKLKESKSLGSKEKAVLKGRFSGFNKDFEDMFEMQSRLFVPDESLRTELRRELRSKILPGYRAFLDKWGDSAFTKNPGKYVKFSAETLESMLNKFFDGALKK